MEWSVDQDPLMVLHAKLTRQCDSLLVERWAYTVKTWVQILVMAGSRYEFELLILILRATLVSKLTASQ